MLRLVIADDEPIILKGIKNMIAKMDTPIEIVGEANNGEQLWQITKENNPDLVITDISMPKLTGTEYIKKLRQAGLDQKVIFVSAYQDFKYAQKAIAYQAIDYIVKPIQQEELILRIKEVSQLLSEEESNHKQKQELKQYKAHAQQAKVAKSLYEYVKSGELSAFFKADFEQLITSYRLSYAAILCIRVEDTVEKLSQQSIFKENESRLLLFSVKNYLETFLSNELQGMLLNYYEFEHCCLVNFSDMNALLENCEKLKDRLFKDLNVRVIIGIGDKVRGAEALSQSYCSAVKKADLYYFVAPQQIITALPKRNETTGVTSETLTGQRQQLFNAVISFNQQEQAAACTAFFNWVRTVANGNKRVGISITFTVISELQEELLQVGLTRDHVTDNNTLLNSLNQTGTFVDLQNYSIELVNTYINDLKLALNDEHVQIRRVKEHINQHYNENITLESMASLFHMNAYYFSSFFKKHTKVNFKKYLTDIRMRKSLNLLLNTNMYIYEIAENVGYNNVRQFSDMFKKYYGKLPNEYKKIT
ncbi:two-component system, response regulator YesN [Amphibacillus marinus]|uniref:Two-component system, response regulator YesN n=1 Tax=Amphibacillus marinus TaxID=872970 RepID=A0A1H8RB20_9BACI|nr:response regulator [Amphibacillus marinus]SEO63566.1 two-component system, response regulator YesN [Amphibacillus marinus]